MKNNELKIAWCYPDMLNLHGDRGNIMALKKVGELLGLKVTIDKIETYDQKIDFENTDIMLFNPGEVKVVDTIVKALKKQNKELTKYIEDDKVIIVIGTTGAVFAKETKRFDGQVIEGLGILDMKCTERELVYGDDIVYKLVDDDKMEINGSQIQIIDTELNADIALGNIQYGHGNNNDKKEGAKYKNVIFTNALGPVLVKNPWFAEKIIRKAAEIKGIEINKEISESEYDIEYKSLECIKKYIEKKTSK